MIQQIPTANAYGGVLLTACGQVLLREPANHFDGYHWTFAKGKSDPEENPERTALREVYEETGYVCQIVGVLPGVYKSSLSGTAMFVMYPLNEQHPYSWETQNTRWVSFAEAKALIGKSTNKAGRERDLQILADARAWFENHRGAELPEAVEYRWQPAQQRDWQNQPLPEKITTVPLGLVFTAQQAALLRMGFVPASQDEKWFSYFADNVLYLHRSWTGICIFKVYFEPEEDGLLATHADVNREPRQYGETEDNNDIGLIQQQLAELADISARLSSLEYQHHSLGGLLQATQPNYLGSPNTVQELFHSYFTTLAGIWEQPGTSNDAYQQMDRLSLIFSGQNENYTTVPGWHSVEQLGQALIKGCGLHADYCSGENLYFHVSEALAAIKIQFDLFRKPYLSLLDDQPALASLVQTLHQLQSYVEQLFLGTHSLSFPDKTLADFVPPVPSQMPGCRIKDGFDTQHIGLSDEDESVEIDILYEALFEEPDEEDEELDEDEDEEYEPRTLN